MNYVLIKLFFKKHKSLTLEKGTTVTGKTLDKKKELNFSLIGSVVLDKWPNLSRSKIPGYQVE
jgi:hypothetical protein